MPRYPVVFAAVLFLAACAPRLPAPTAAPTVTAPTLTLAAALPRGTPVRYPTLPPEWTATAIPTFTATPLPPTPTQTYTPVPTLPYTVTPSVAGAVFTGSASLLNQPLALTDGRYHVDWEYLGLADTHFVFRLASPDSNSTVTFVDALGAQRGASDLRIVGLADLLLSVEAAGDWVVLIRPAAPRTTATPAHLTETPASVPLPAPT
ncbi:MAG: hypothetical protein IT317_02410 [Anaerolineales bacterium]|nr:hypothetical protein [Anaerolineales bacterium]